MDLKTAKKNFKQSWYLITIIDTVMARVNTLWGDQPKQLTFTDRQGCLIGDVKIPGVGDKSEEEEVELP